MTPEQLDEIEKLAEAATPGPWNHSFEFIHPNDGRISDAFIVCRHTKGGYDAAFLCAMREYALPLVKALRESKAKLKKRTTERNHAQQKHEEALDMCQRYIEHLHKAIKEGDEARSLQAHWAADADAKEALLQSVARVCRGSKEPDQADLSVLGDVLRERDRARAYAEERNDEANKLQRVLNITAQERDDAKAEVERLRSAISRFVAQYPWQAGPEIQELKALKEEG